MRVFIYLFHYLYKFSKFKEILGNDERYILYPDYYSENITYNKIIRIHEIKNIIEKIEKNNNFEICDEMCDEILENSKKIKTFNIKNGGLFTDWNMYFE